MEFVSLNSFYINYCHRISAFLTIIFNIYCTILFFFNSLVVYTFEREQVHDQRKYAQVADIPISNPSTSVETTVGDPDIQNTSKMFYNKNDAERLLNIVSLSSIHRDRQPIVIVKRLENTLEAMKNERSIPNHETHNQSIENHNAIELPETREPNKEIVLISPPSPQSSMESGIPLKLIREKMLSIKIRRSSRLRRKRAMFKPKGNIITTNRNTKFMKAPITEANDSVAVCPSTDFNNKPQQTKKDITESKAFKIPEIPQKKKKINKSPTNTCPAKTAPPVKVLETNGDKQGCTKPTNSPEKRLNPNDGTTSDTKKKKIEKNFPKRLDRAKLVDAPIFYPSEDEFTDPISYFEKVMPIASQFGICKVVPPAGFNPTCTLSETNGFTVTNQYIPRLYTRWGPAFREMCAIRLYLDSQKVHFTRAPLLGGLEVNLPKMYHTVQRLGGLNNVFDKKRWNRVAEEMHFYQLTDPSKKLGEIYDKYLLPYDTLTNGEKQMKISVVEQMWQKKNKKMLARAINPLFRQKRLLGDSNSDSDSDSDQDAPLDSDKEKATSHASDPLAEAEECIVPGRIMNLNNFQKVAQNAFKMYIPPNEEASTRTIENLYWELVLFGADHVCVNSASVDTGEDGYGFTKDKSSPYGEHPWNLKMLSQNNGNILRPLGEVLGLTVPTLHLGMIFSTSCWHRDPHGMPWIEYMHQGSEKIWYGIPNEQSQKFRKAVEILCPTVCQNKSIWLSSDVTMIPPNMLLEHEVSLSKITQKPGEFVIVFPKAYSSSICTGYTISESVYFATKSWLSTMENVFQTMRESCEKPRFALEQLLIAIAGDPRSSLAVLQCARATLSTAITDELAARAVLKRHGMQVTINKGSGGERRLIRHQDECAICRTTLYLSKVKGIFGEQSALCVQHALRVLVENKTESEAKKKIDNNIELEVFITKREFKEIEQNLQKRLLSINP